jgi:hypothetical protein
LANIELHAIALQHRRLHSSEAEDDQFVMRWWVDLQFLVVALRRFRRAVTIAITDRDSDLKAALGSFDAALPSLETMRNIGEHLDAYAIDDPKRHDEAIDRRQLEVGDWDGRKFRWLKQSDGTAHELDIDIALAAARDLYAALCETALPGDQRSSVSS